MKIHLNFSQNPALILGSITVVNLEQCTFIDHSVMETLHHLEEDFKLEGGNLEIIGMENFRNTGNSKHSLASKKRKKY